MNDTEKTGRLRTFERRFTILNAAVFTALLAWIALLHFSTSNEPPSRIVPGALPETTRERAATSEPPSGEIAALEGYTLEDQGDRAIDPQHLRARELFRAGRAKEALAAIRSLIARNPTAALLRNDEGVYLSSLQDTGGAAASFEEAIRLSPSYARAHYNLGTLLLKNEEPGSAVERFDRALVSNPYYGEARFNRALARSKLGDVAGAVEDYEFLTQSDRTGTSIKAYYNLGLLHMRAGRENEALRSFTAALRKQPDHIGARFNKALLLSRGGLEDEAMVEYEKLLVLVPEHEGALLNAGAYSLRKERWAEAIGYFERLLAIDPGNARAHYNLGLCYARTGDMDASIAAFKAAIASEPAYAEAWYNLGLAYKRAGRHEEAVQAFQAAVELQPERATYHYNLALAHFERGDLQQSIASYRAALALKPDYYRARYNLALAHLRVEDYARAIESFSLAEELQPESYPAIYNRGVALLKMGSPAEAEEALRAALDLQDSIEAGYNLGLALKRQGKLDDAIDTFHAVLRTDPKHAPSIERLAEVYSELGSHEESLQKLVLLQKLVPDDPTAFNIGLAHFKEGEAPLALRYFEIAEMGVGELRRKGLVMQYQALKQMDETSAALAVLERAIPEYPENEVILRGLSRLLTELQRHEDAARHLRALQALHPDDPTAFNAGLRLYRSEKYQSALGYFEVASAGGEPIATKGMNMQALAYRKLGEDAEAEAIFRAALDRFPHYGPVVRNLSETLSDAGRHAEAANVLQDFLAGTPQPDRLADTLYLLGNELLATGKPESARDAFEKTLEADSNHQGARKALRAMGVPPAIRSKS